MEEVQREDADREREEERRGRPERGEEAGKRRRNGTKVGVHRKFVKTG